MIAAALAPYVLGVSFWMPVSSYVHTATYSDDCAVTVWDSSLGLCYGEDAPDLESATCSEFRVYCGRNALTGETSSCDVETYDDPACDPTVTE